jgi:flagellar basal-body rod modification protein FlgD
MTPKAPKSELNLETFLRLLTVQLQTQNPLEPMNDRDFFAQMAQLGQVQGMDNLKASAEIERATGMIGKTVTALRPMTDSDTGRDSLVTGVVERSFVRNGEQFLAVRESNGGTVDIRLNNVQAVHASSMAAELPNYSHLIGRQAEGPGVARIEEMVEQPNGEKVKRVRQYDVLAKGEIVGVDAQGGIPRVRIRTEKDGIVPVQIANLSRIGS